MGILQQARDYVAKRLTGMTASEVQDTQDRVRYLRQSMGNAQASGVNIQSGRFEYELNQDLHSPDKWDELERMQYDPVVKGALRLNSLPLITQDWDFEPASDKPKDVEAAEFCNANLLRKPSDKYGPEFWIETSWRGQRLPEILTMHPYGFSMFHKAFRRVGTKEVYRRLTWLEPSSVDPRGWQLDDEDNIVQVERTFRLPSSQYCFLDPIPAEEIALYVWDLQGARFEGTPFTRSMYGAWFRKDQLIRNMAIWAQKAAAPAPFGVYPREGWSSDEILKFQDYIQSLRGSAPAEAFGVFPMGEDGSKPEARYAGAEHGDLDKGVPLANFENAEIARAGSAKSQLLGETANGSRALGDSLGMIEQLQIMATVEVIAEQEVFGVGNLKGVVQDLVDRNFTGVSGYPMPRPPKINPFDMVDMTDSLIKAWSAGGLIPKTPESRRQITERFGINLPDDAYEIEEPPMEPPGMVPPGQPGRANPPVNSPQQSPEGTDQAAPEEPMQRAAVALESRDEFAARIAPMLAIDQEARPTKGGGFRPQNEFEKRFCRLGEVNLTMREGERATAATLRRIEAEMKADLLNRVAEGKITPRNLDGQRRSKHRGQARAVREMGRSLDRLANRGIDDAAEELERQNGS